MKFYANRTVAEQMERLPLEYRANYEVTQLDRIEIDGQTLQGYFEYSFLEEKSYHEQPVRSQDGTIQDINSYTTFLTPRLIIKYNMMAIEDYRALMKMLKSKNAFMVTCYDIVEDKRVTHEMYFAPPSMPIIYQQYLMALGIQEYSIELIGTNKVSRYNIYYLHNIDSVNSSPYYEYAGDGELFSQATVLANSSTVIGDADTMKIIVFDGTTGTKHITLNEMFAGDYIVKSWNTKRDGTGYSYTDGEAHYLSSDTVLFAQWEIN